MGSQREEKAFSSTDLLSSCADRAHTEGRNDNHFTVLRNGRKRHNGKKAEKRQEEGREVKPSCRAGGAGTGSLQLGSGWSTLSSSVSINQHLPVRGRQLPTLLFGKAELKHHKKSKAFLDQTKTIKKPGSNSMEPATNGSSNVFPQVICICTLLLGEGQLL